jgi:hypothetical protein
MLPLTRYQVWKTWAPGKCKTFIWLAIRNPCSTADRLQKRGLPHPVKSVEPLTRRASATQLVAFGRLLRWGYSSQPQA